MGRLATRRAFCVGAAGVAAGAAAAAVVRPLVGHADLLRPPGSLPEPDFMALCVKCGRCISVCPTDCLRPVGAEEGLLEARTPVMDYARDWCIFCDKCREVCPTAAVGPVDAHAPLEGRIGVAVLREDLCLAFLEAGSCGICKDACDEYEAISFDEGRRPVVDADKCNGCGECEAICPANVFTSFGGGRRGIEVVTERAFQQEVAR